jgi:cobalt-zinc-cadmium efflux system outer membrane protein
VRRGWAVVAVVAAVSGPLLAAPRARAAGLTMEQAVTLALQHNRDAIAARLEIEVAQLDVVAARVYPNPTLSYAAGNLVLGHGNVQPPATANPGFLDQPVQTVGVTQVLDVWSKRGARARAAGQGVEQRRLLTEDALREIVYAVRSAFADVVREQSERDLAHEVAERYAETVRISQARFRAGDISEAELRKIEIEAIRYQNQVIDAEMQLDVSRQRLASLLGLSSAHELPAERVQEADARPVFDAAQLAVTALAQRPDLRAAGAARTVAEARLSAAQREVYPDVELGANYTHSRFTIAGDNANTLGLSLALPLPLFDRNRAGVGRAHLDIRRAENDRERLRIEVEREVAEAVRKAARAQLLLRIYEGDGVAGAGAPAAHAAEAGSSAPSATRDTGGMLARAEIALRVAEKSYKAGAVSLLELLEAQRTNLETRAQYLRALYDFRQASIDVTHAVGEGTP